MALEGKDDYTLWGMEMCDSPVCSRPPELGAGHGPDPSSAANTTVEFLHQENHLTPSRREPSSALLCINVGKQGIMKWGQADCDPKYSLKSLLF